MAKRCELLALDPSSTRTGYALMNRSIRPGICHEILEAGYLQPNRSKDPAIERIRVMGDDLATLVKQETPRTIVIEITSGKVAGRLHGRASGLAVYGMAVGVMFWIARLTEPAIEVVPVAENEWTGQRPKKKRQADIGWQFPEYSDQMALDGGADIADAIGLGLWWFGKQRTARIA